MAVLNVTETQAGEYLLYIQSEAANYTVLFTVSIPSKSSSLLGAPAPMGAPRDWVLQHPTGAPQDWVLQHPMGAPQEWVLQHPTGHLGTGYISTPWEHIRTGCSSTPRGHLGTGRFSTPRGYFWVLQHPMEVSQDSLYFFLTAGVIKFRYSGVLNTDLEEMENILT